MYKQQAQQVFEWLSSNKDMPEFIVTYRVGRFDHNERVYATSPRLKPHFPELPGENIEHYIRLTDGKVWFLYPNKDGPYAARRLQSNWGSQIYVYFEKESFLENLTKFGKWLDSLDGTIKRIVAIMLSATLFLVSAVGSIHDLIQSKQEKEPVSVSYGKAKMDKIMEKTYLELGLSHSLVFYRYTENCTHRRLEHYYSPYIRPSYAEKYRDVNVAIRGWREQLAAHKLGKSHITKISSLPEDSQLRVALEGIGIHEVITTPVVKTLGDCPIGYLSAGYTRELTDREETNAIVVLERAVVPLQAWEELTHV